LHIKSIYFLTNKYGTLRNNAQEYLRDFGIRASQISESL